MMEKVMQCIEAFHKRSARKLDLRGLPLGERGRISFDMSTSSFE